MKRRTFIQRIATALSIIPLAKIPFKQRPRIVTGMGVLKPEIGSHAITPADVAELWPIFRRLPK